MCHRKDQQAKPFPFGEGDRTKRGRMRAMPSPLGRVVEQKAKPGEVLCLFRHGLRRATFSKGEGFGVQKIGLPGIPAGRWSLFAVVLDHRNIVGSAEAYAVSAVGSIILAHFVTICTVE